MQFGSNHDWRQRNSPPVGARVRLSQKRACCGKSPDAVLTPVAVDINTIRHIRGRESVFTAGCKLYHIRSKFGAQDCLRERGLKLTADRNRFMENPVDPA